ncbi:MAG: MFS transporter [Dehalococcoidia bacterium]|nr:MFS transporter [Dehalococcoidia bacterium]
MPLSVTAGVQAALSRRWLQVAAAAMFINTSYGTLSYAFSVLVTKSGPGGEFGAGAVSLGFGLALLVSGAAGIFAGTIADLLGTRRLMAGGAVIGCIGLALLGAVQESWQLILVMAVVLGPAMAATFYEPVYVLMNRWFAAGDRPRAYGVLTLMSGISITIFTPLTRFLVSELGWRQAVVVLGGILLAVGTLVPALLQEPIERVDGAPRLTPRRFATEAREGLGQANAAFWVFTLAFVAATVAFSGFSFHMISQLETRGFDETAVANTIALTGIVSLPARLILPMLSGRAPSATLLAVCFALLGVAAWLASVAGAWWQVWVYIAVFGAVFGAVYPLRALVVSERFAGPYFGRVIGLQALFVAMARASGPVAIGLIGTSQSGYEFGFRLAAGVLVVMAAVTWWSMRR